MLVGDRKRVGKGCDQVLPGVGRIVVRVAMPHIVHVPCARAEGDDRGAHHLAGSSNGTQTHQPFVTDEGVGMDHVVGAGDGVDYV